MHIRNPEVRFSYTTKFGGSKPTRSIFMFWDKTQFRSYKNVRPDSADGRGHPLPAGSHLEDTGSKPGLRRVN